MRDSIELHSEKLHNLHNINTARKSMLLEWKWRLALLTNGGLIKVVIRKPGEHAVRY
jgi:hypothetical protein